MSNMMKTSTLHTVRFFFAVAIFLSAGMDVFTSWNDLAILSAGSVSALVATIAAKIFVPTIIV